MARTKINSSVRGERVLKDLGVLTAFERGGRRILVGPTYGVRKQPDSEIRMIFECAADRSIAVGYARNESGEWETVETEPYSLRAYGYYERRLKRIGDFVRNQPPFTLYD